ncbi:hypothetical protein CDL12_06225 [Handroanthus impetiginosus]|uniref:S-adenosyl-L-methionine-dependent methyltransferase n=1 Tax=Handroanthus impetiginosus TaxID=429701 RepID=A0A2G9HU96_9LAMI|nr:hypothetical protein CDL12_06225 [Handroanthus impetiginosus]
MEKRMTGWSPENATKAYLRAVKMVKRAMAPDAAEFISALVAGSNARLIVISCADAADSTVLALVVAAHQTGGKVVCIVSSANELKQSKETLGESAEDIEYVVGNAENLLSSEYREADCVVVDCRIKNCEGILKAAKGIGKNVMVLGYNALWMGSWRCGGFDAHLLPIGEGLVVSRAAEKTKNDEHRCGSGKRSRWVVKVDKVTGEEHVFRVRSS